MSYPAPAAPTGSVTLDGAGFPLYTTGTHLFLFGRGHRYVQGPPPLTNATASAFGGVDAVTVAGTGGFGYTNPTVDFDLPDNPNGVKAVAHAVCDGDTTCGAGGTITAIVVDQPGSGYASHPMS